MEHLTAFLTRMPKVELHVHLESTMPGEMLARFAARQGRELPRPAERLYDCSADDFLAFLDNICSFVGTPEELAEAAEHAALESGREHILYSEMILNPTHWPQFSVPEIIAAVTAGFDRAAAQGGADCRFTLSLSRTQTGAEAMALVEDMKAHRTHRLAGLSIDGNEALAGRTGGRFRPAFLAAGAAGFGGTAHAGESSGPDGVRDALDLLEADRLDHGVRAAEDADLTARLVRERVPLNICLTSNLTLLYRRREDHPLRRLLDAGAVVTLSRDDPTFLGGLTLTEELRRAAEFAYMSREELLACQEAAVDAAFCGPETKNFLRRALAEFQQRCGGDAVPLQNFGRADRRSQALPRIRWVVSRAETPDIISMKRGNSFAYQ